MEEGWGRDDIAVIDQDQASEQHLQLLQRHPQVGSETEMEAHTRRLREAEEAEQFLNLARFDSENEAHVRRLRGAGVEHEPLKVESAVMETWNLHAGQPIELADNERLATSHTTSRAASVIFDVDEDSEVAGDHYFAVPDLLDAEMEL